MRKCGRSAGLLTTFIVLTLTGLSLLAAQSTDVRWDRMIGIILAGNNVGSGAGQVTGAGAAWVATGGNADVDLQTGQLRFRVAGLVLAVGNSIGTRAAITQVKGTLVCDTNGSAGGSFLVDTPLVDLSPQGDARFSGNVGPLPPACSTEPDIAFLVRIPSGVWIAAGTVRTP